MLGVDQVCPRRPYVVVADDDPSLRFPASCDSYGCQQCGPRKAMQAAAVAAWSIRHAERARFVTFTRMPDRWQDRRHEMRRIVQQVRRDGYRWEAGWTTEVGSKSGMVHVHALQHGSYVPQRYLQDVAGSRVDIRAVQTGGVAQYVTKDSLRVAGYVTKNGTAEHGGLGDFLALNGGRPMHWTRGFLHGSTKREALSDLRAELAAGQAHDWHLEPVSRL